MVPVGGFQLSRFQPTESGWSVSRDKLALPDSGKAMEIGIPLAGAPQSHLGLKYSTVIFDGEITLSGSGGLSGRRSVSPESQGKPPIWTRFREMAMGWRGLYG